jgi:hypothetical protein
MNKTRIHCIRFTEAEWSLIHDRAQRCGQSFSAYLRQVGLGAIPRQKPGAVEEKVLYHLARVGNNLNQIARKANSGIPVPESEIREALKQHLEVLEAFRCR